MAKRREITATGYIILSALRSAGEEGMTSVEMTEKFKYDERMKGVAIGQKMTKMHEDVYIGRTFEQRVSDNTGRPAYVYQDLQLGNPYPFGHNICVCPGCGVVHTAQAKIA